jgi:diguanylate cyclase (GGDEF)-like protein
MQVLTRLKAKIRWHHMVHIGIFLFALVLWPVLGELDLLEAFFEYSRAHESWELDELAVLGLLLTFALLFSVIFQGRHLRRMERERAEMNRKVKDSARHDPLTGALNRRAFLDNIEQILSADGSEVDVRHVAFLGLDKFRNINNLHGHRSGDAVLIEVAERLQSEVGAGGIVARLAGDEFAVVYGPMITQGRAERVAQRLVHEIGKPVWVDQNTEIRVGVSVGLVTLQPEDTVTEFMRCAAKAMQMAKEHARGRFAWYDAELDRQSLDREQLASDLRKAIARDEVVPWFQPIVEIDQNQVSGVEVLARWKHPERGFISPAVFIEIAEDIGQIGALGLSVLRQACMQAKEWPVPLTISFNVSGVQFKDSALVPSIRLLLQGTGFPANRLIIEVTESSVIDDFAVARGKLEELKALGVAVALDDFGTGNSSLACLQNLPFDRLKIDRSFVTGISDQPQSQKIVSGIIGLAQGLQLEVTAEGIETLEDLSYVTYLDCNRGQGFLYDQAIPGEQVVAQLADKWRDLPTAPQAISQAAGKT